jgi:hypothetical protein
LTSDVGGREFNPEEADEGGDDLIQWETSGFELEEVRT